MDPRYLKVKEVKQGPMKINLNQLLGSFEILIFGSCLAVLVLAMEVVAEKFKVKIMKKMFVLLM